MKINNDNLQSSIKVSMEDGQSEYDKKKIKIAKMLGDNPIAKKMEESMDEIKKMDERYEEWEAIQCIMSAAREVYMDSGDFKKTVSSLIDALSKISKDSKETKHD